MEQNSVSVWKSSLNYGLFLGIALILVTVLYYASGNIFAKSAGWVGWGIMIAGVVIAQLQYRKELGGFMSYGQALGVGVLTMLFASVLNSFVTYILFAVIDPSLQEQARLAMEEELVMRQNVPEEQLDMMIEMTTRLKNPAVMFVLNIFSGVVTGFLISLLTSIFTQKKSQEFI